MSSGKKQKKQAKNTNSSKCKDISKNILGTVDIDDELIDMTQHEDIYTNSYGSSQNQNLFDEDSFSTIDTTNGVDDIDQTDHNSTNLDITAGQENKPTDESSSISEHSKSKDSCVSTSFDTDHAHKDKGKNTRIVTKSVSDALARAGSVDVPVTHLIDINTNDDLSLSSARIFSGRSRVAFPNGYLKIVTGCMFSGKTTYIIRECKKWQSIGKHVLMINYALDRRYSDQDKIISHDKYSVDCMMIDKFTPKLSKKIEAYDVILINEGQFFSDLKINVHYWCDELKKIVVVSGLDGDFMRGKFGEILDLIPSCDDHIKLKAYCSMCKDGTDAIFTWKIKNRSLDCSVVVDIGIDKYVPLCRKHYNQECKKMLAVAKMII